METPMDDAPSVMYTITHNEGFQNVLTQAIANSQVLTTLLSEIDGMFKLYRGYRKETSEISILLNELIFGFLLRNEIEMAIMVWRRIPEEFWQKDMSLQNAKYILKGLSTRDYKTVYRGVHEFYWPTTTEHLPRGFSRFFRERVLQEIYQNHNELSLPEVAHYMGVGALGKSAITKLLIENNWHFQVNGSKFMPPQVSVQYWIQSLLTSIEEKAGLGHVNSCPDLCSDDELESLDLGTQENWDTDSTALFHQMDFDKTWRPGIDLKYINSARLAREKALAAQEHGAFKRAHPAAASKCDEGSSTDSQSILEGGCDWPVHTEPIDDWAERQKFWDSKQCNVSSYLRQYLNGVIENEYRPPVKYRLTKHNLAILDSLTHQENALRPSVRLRSGRYEPGKGTLAKHPSPPVARAPSPTQPLGESPVTSTETISAGGPTPGSLPTTIPSFPQPGAVDNNVKSRVNIKLLEAIALESLPPAVGSWPVRTPSTDALREQQMVMPMTDEQVMEVFSSYFERRG